MNKTKFFLIRTIIVTTTLILTGCGNSALHWIQDGDKIIVPGSEKVISQKLQVENIKPPTQLEPIVSLQVAQVDKTNLSYYYNLKEVKKEWTYTSTFHIANWTFGWIVLSPLWIYSVRNEKNEKEIETPPETLSGEIAGYPVAGAQGIIIKWSPTGKIKDSNTDTEVVENKQFFNNSEIFVKYLKYEKEYSTNYFGEVKVDLVEDFNLIRSENDDPVEVIILDTERKLSTSLSIKPNDWMVEYIKVKSNGIEVIGESGNQTITLGRLKAGEEYRLLHKGTQLWKIDYKGKEGFIPPNSGEIFWAVPGYKK